MFKEYIPKSFLCFRSGYSLATFRKDLFAGLTVGIIALPLSMAFAIASGTTPERGLFTAIIAGFLISAFGGSRIQIGGPTGAFVVLIYHIIQRTGYEGLALSTLIASALLILFGLFRLGSFIKYIPQPLVTGFTTGIAVLIFSSQVKDFFGLNMGALPAGFVEKWSAYLHVAGSVHLPTFFLGASTLALIVAIRIFIPKLPWGVTGMVWASLLAYFLDLPVETIQSKFGQLPSGLPSPSLPSFAIAAGRFSEIFSDGLAIALLAAIESLLSAVIGDGMIGGRHKPNCELIAQGIGNFGSILFGGIPATGAIARTAANVKTGAQTPAAGMIHALVLFFFIAFCAPVVSQIPLAALAAILMMVSWNMSEIPHFLRLFKAPVGDIAVLLTAFLLTIFVDITFAIMGGMILASFLFMKRMSHSSKTVRAIENQTLPGAEIYEIEGPLFFGVTDLLKDLPLNREKPPQIFILRLRHVPLIDASGMHALKELEQTCQRAQTQLLLTDVHEKIGKELKKFGLAHLLAGD